MENRLIHIAPFDIGSSFFDYEYTKKQSKEEFVGNISSKCRGKGIVIDEVLNDKYMCVAKLNEKISCYLLECGVGVFVFKNLDIPDMERFNKMFGKDCIYNLYYRKKIEQKKILNQEDIVIVKDFMDVVWSSVHKMIRPFSACNNYKHNGLSYVMSVYHIIDNSINLHREYNKDIDLLMNPGILSKIEKEEQWNSIKDKIEKHREIGYNRQEFSDVSVVASSWSAVAVVEEKETEAILKIIDYEVSLQASWLLFDCIIDNIKQSKLSNLDLQKEKSLVTDVSLDISNILKSDTSTKRRKIVKKPAKSTFLSA